MSKDVCPRCSAPMDPSAHVCEDHDVADGVCEACGLRSRVTVEPYCRNCPHSAKGFFELYLLATTEPIAFVASRGFDPITQAELRAAVEREPEIVSTDPFEGRFTLTIGDDPITLTVDDDLDVFDVTEHRATDAA